MHKQKVIIIGIDGVPYGLLKDLSDRDVMPHFKELRKNGVFTQMESSIPEISSVSWSSIITGKNPGEHGIYGFTDLVPHTYTISFPNFRNLKAKAFWQKEEDKTHVIINVPSTYPVQKINGFWVSGFVSLDLEKAVYPPPYIEKLKEMNYQVDVDSRKAHKSKRLFLEDLFKVHKKRIELYRYLWNKINWDTFMLVFTGSDRLEHFLWDAYEDSNHEYHHKFLEYFQKVDEIIGEIATSMSENDSLIMLSDHGMEKIKTNVNLNTYLADNDFLKWGDHPEKRYRNIESGTKAFALDPARIYINKENKYPKGSVKITEEEKVIDDLIDSFSRLERNGEKVIKKIYKKNDIYHGEYVVNAPDLVLLPNSGYSLRGSMGKRDLFEDDSIIVGMHTQQDAFLFVKNDGNKDIVPQNPNVENITSIMQKLRRR